MLTVLPPRLGRYHRSCHHLRYERPGEPGPGVLLYARFRMDCSPRRMRSEMIRRVGHALDVARVDAASRGEELERVGREFDRALANGWI